MTVRLTEILSYLPELEEEAAIAAIKSVLQDHKVRRLAWSLSEESGATYLASQVRTYCGLESVKLRTVKRQEQPPKCRIKQSGDQISGETESPKKQKRARLKPKIETPLRLQKQIHIEPTGIGYTDCQFGYRLWAALFSPGTARLVAARLVVDHSKVSYYLSKWLNEGWVEISGYQPRKYPPPPPIYVRVGAQCPFVVTRCRGSLPSVDQILQAIVSGKKTKTAIAAATGASYDTVNRLLTTLVERGLIVLVGSDRRAQFFVPQELEKDIGQFA